MGILLKIRNAFRKKNCDPKERTVELLQLSLDLANTPFLLTLQDIQFILEDLLQGKAFSDFLFIFQQNDTALALFFLIQWNIQKAGGVRRRYSFFLAFLQRRGSPSPDPTTLFLHLCRMRRLAILRPEVEKIHKDARQEDYGEYLVSQYQEQFQITHAELTQQVLRNGHLSQCPGMKVDLQPTDLIQGFGVPPLALMYVRSITKGRMLFEAFERGFSKNNPPPPGAHVYMLRYSVSHLCHLVMETCKLNNGVFELSSHKFCFVANSTSPFGWQLRSCPLGQENEGEDMILGGEDEEILFPNFQDLCAAVGVNPQAYAKPYKNKRLQ